ncbi:unnamed protein product [Rotaria magnacalcarata]
MNDEGDEIPYCQRLNSSEALKRSRTRCENGGKEILFRDLIQSVIEPIEVLKWSTSIEIADLYARVFYNASAIEDNDKNFVCQCNQPGTFGKYCEYLLGGSYNYFGETLEAQFSKKASEDSWNTQRYGHILCYTTLPCLGRHLCLDWREICDGVQQCKFGTDEENWDLLEFNECEDDEFRCRNGMCIPEEFWLDGDYDCMDQSDELYRDDGEYCHSSHDAMTCDEHICRPNTYSCGDGQCIFWHTRMPFNRLDPIEDDCVNKRNINYMCEVSRTRFLWTLPNGLCWPDANYDDKRYPVWSNTYSTNISWMVQCTYLIKCLLSNGFERKCPCNRKNCSQLIRSTCASLRFIFYPPPGVISHNLFFLYDALDPLQSITNLGVGLNGTLKCKGFLLETKPPLLLFPPLKVIFLQPNFNSILCDPQYIPEESANRVFDTFFQYHPSCWNGSFTFNGRSYAVHPNACLSAGTCISQYRILDGESDCYDESDEIRDFEKNFCTGNVGRHRFQCFSDENKCIPLYLLGTRTLECSNQYDEIWRNTGISLTEVRACHKSDHHDCARLKHYIRRSSQTNFTEDFDNINISKQLSTKNIPFRFYCDTFWDLDDHIDERPELCNDWICEKHQFQCQTGQCIDVDWVCDGEWDCADASDEEAISFNIDRLHHNAHVTDLPKRVENCQNLYRNTSFSMFCNSSFEFGCFRSNVENPLNIQSNRPCINLTQIGDEIQDCYNAYDEKNTFEANGGILGMWGFHYRCGSIVDSYQNICSEKDSNCSSILCSKLRDPSKSCFGPLDVFCLEENRCVKNARCNKTRECKHGDDEYWCASTVGQDKTFYRFEKERKYRSSLNFSFTRRYAPEDRTHSMKLFKERGILIQNELPIEYFYSCNRGAAIFMMNEMRCFCPPAYYGRWCEFFSDRITIITVVDRAKFSFMMLSNILKVRANLLHENETIDFHEFHIIPTIENAQRVKHRFYLRYSYSFEMLQKKKHRFFNRSDIVDRHPYSVHFDIFELLENATAKELGSWHYPIYFDYLPSFRLAVILKLPSLPLDTAADPCQHSRCNRNSNCKPVFNDNQTYYCSCKSGFYGKDCHFYEPRCETHCSVRSLCRPHGNNVKQPSINCICPMDHFGPGCHLQYNDCKSNPCLNSGICFPTYSYSGEVSYVCVCSERFYGKRCELRKASVFLQLNMTTNLKILATSIQLYDVNPKTLDLIIRYQQVEHGMVSVVSYLHSDTYSPYIGLLKMYDLDEQKYYVMYAMLESTVDIVSQPHFCQSVLSILPNSKSFDN